MSIFTSYFTKLMDYSQTIPIFWKYFLPNFEFRNIFCQLGWQDLPLFAKLNSNFNLNYNWVEYSINFVFFSSTTHPPTRNSSDSSTITSISTSTELKISVTSSTTQTKLNLSLAQLSPSLFFKFFNFFQVYVQKSNCTKFFQVLANFFQDWSCTK